MSRDDVYLIDILEAARLAMEYVRGKTREEFLNDVQVQDAVMRRLAIIGEAARRVSEATRQDMPELAWREMVGMRNIVVHEYDDVDLDVIWDAVTRDLPPLANALARRVPPEKP
jgi:uncharacterized protein with HEPN domain